MYTSAETQIAKKPVVCRNGRDTGKGSAYFSLGQFLFRKYKRRVIRIGQCDLFYESKDECKIIVKDSTRCTNLK